MTVLAVFVPLLLLDGLVSGLVERSPLTAPIVFTAAGAARGIAAGARRVEAPGPDAAELK